MCKIFNISAVEVSKSERMIIHVHVFIYNSESKDISARSIKTLLFNSLSNKVFVAAVVIVVFNVVSYMQAVLVMFYSG